MLKYKLSVQIIVFLSEVVIEKKVLFFYPNIFIVYFSSSSGISSSKARESFELKFELISICSDLFYWLNKPRNK